MKRRRERWVLSRIRKHYFSNVFVDHLIDGNLLFSKDILEIRAREMEKAVERFVTICSKWVSCLTNLCRTAAERIIEKGQMHEQEKITVSLEMQYAFPNDTPTYSGRRLTALLLDWQTPKR